MVARLGIVMHLYILINFLVGVITITVRNKFFNDYLSYRDLEKLIKTRTTSAIKIYLKLFLDLREVLYL